MSSRFERGAALAWKQAQAVDARPGSNG